MKKLILCILAAGIVSLPALCRAGAPAYIENSIGQTEFMINSGYMFEINYTSNSLTAGATLYVAVDIASSTFETLHAYIDVQSSSSTYVVVFDSPTLTSSGTVINSYNMNRASTFTAQSVWYIAPTVSANGTAFVRDSINYGMPHNPMSKVVLDPGRMYLISIKNNCGAITNNNIKLRFIEVEP